MKIEYIEAMKMQQLHTYATIVIFILTNRQPEQSHEKEHIEYRPANLGWPGV